MDAEARHSSHTGKQFEAKAWEALDTKLSRRTSQILRNITPKHATLDDSPVQMAMTAPQRGSPAPHLGPPWGKVMLQPGNPTLDLRNFYFPPYEAQNTNQWHSGDPQDWQQFADGTHGTVQVIEFIVEHGAAGWGWAGVGMWYKPQTQLPTLVYFRPLIDSAWDVELRSRLLSCSSQGKVGVQVFSFSGDVSSIRDEGSSTLDIFTQDDVVDDTVELQDENLLALELAVPYDSTRQYLCFAFLLAISDASGNSNLAGSVAGTNVFAQVPWIATEEIGT